MSRILLTHTAKLPEQVPLLRLPPQSAIRRAAMGFGTTYGTGSGDYLLAPLGGDLSGWVTMSIWFKRIQLNAISYLFWTTMAGGGVQQPVRLRFMTTNVVQFMFGRVTTTQVFNGPTVTDTAAWHHLIICGLSYEDTNVNFAGSGYYSLDGGAAAGVGRGQDGVGGPTSMLAANVGVANNAVDSANDILLRDAALWRRRLSREEMRRVFRAGPLAVSDDELRYYNALDGADNPVVGRKGTVSGAKAVTATVPLSVQRSRLPTGMLPVVGETWKPKGISEPKPPSVNHRRAWGFGATSGVNNTDEVSIRGHWNITDGAPAEKYVLSAPHTILTNFKRDGSAPGYNPYLWGSNASFLLHDDLGSWSGGADKLMADFYWTGGAHRRKSNTTINDTNWHRMVYTCDPSNVSTTPNPRALIDGTWDTFDTLVTQGLTAQGTSGTPRLRIGNNQDNVAWAGHMSGFALWSRILTDAECWAVYRYGPFAVLLDLVFYEPLDGQPFWTPNKAKWFAGPAVRDLPNVRGKLVAAPAGLRPYVPLIFGGVERPRFYSLGIETPASTFAPNWYFLGSTVGGGWGELQVGGSAPADSTLGTGWRSEGVSAGQYARMAFGSVRTADQFSGTAQPSSGPDNTLYDCWRSSSTLTGSIAAGDWVIRVPLIAPDAPNEGANLRLRLRLWKSSNANGSTPTEITSGAEVGSTVTNLQSEASQYSEFSFTLGEITLSSDYLFFQVAAETV